MSVEIKPGGLERPKRELIPVESYEQIWADYWAEIARIDKQIKREKILFSIIIFLILCAGFVIFVQINRP